MTNGSYRNWTKVCALAGVLMVTNVTGVSVPVWAADVPGLQGPRYFADLQLKNGTATLPATGAFTQKMEVDTGAPLTTLTRAAAKSFSLLKADDTDNGFRDDDIELGGVGGGGITAQYSTKLSFLAKGKKKDGTTDAEPSFTQVDDLRIVYPKKGEKDIDILLGTNYIAGLKGGAKFVANPDGSCTFAAPPAPPPPPPGPARKTGLQLRGMPGWPNGLGVQYLVPGISLNGTTADFVLTTGSPYTIISSQLATTLGLRPMGTYDLYNADPDAFIALMVDGFFDGTNPGPFGVAMVSQLTIPTEDGSGVVYNNVPVLINPFASTDNVFGTNLLNPGGMATAVDLYDGYLQYGLVPTTYYPYPPPPPPPTPTPTGTTTSIHP